MAHVRHVPILSLLRSALQVKLVSGHPSYLKYMSAGGLLGLCDYY